MSKSVWSLITSRTSMYPTINMGGCDASLLIRGSPAGCIFSLLSVWHLEVGMGKMYQYMDVYQYLYTGVLPV
jgi:hypothetical protein